MVEDEPVIERVIVVHTTGISTYPERFLPVDVDTADGKMT